MSWSFNKPSNYRSKRLYNIHLLDLHLSIKSMYCHPPVICGPLHQCLAICLVAASLLDLLIYFFVPIIFICCAEIMDWEVLGRCYTK